jgi:hypothetical protein
MGGDEQLDALVKAVPAPFDITPSDRFDREVGSVGHVAD